ncbi:TetR/AcrR family transcriptional regulator [Prescottella subtropica]|uniref:TetR/AcrR family transcriptional regulator n=1 Tax=Prescottella subtropica TaxID=2545757 RepID=UPI0010F75BDC|nr:TetR/AcrR family transcriptional regulator [Prescottella subtropica]
MATTRRDDILRHAARLFSERGVAGTTVRDIADAVGILSGSLYHYFASKDDIAFEIVIAFVDDLNGRYEAAVACGGSARERLDRMVTVAFAAAIDHPYATEIYQNESVLSSQPEDGAITTAVRRAHGIWADTIDEGVAAGEFRPDLDARHFHRMFSDAVWSTVRVSRPTLDRDADRLRHNLIAVFLDGFATGAPGVSTMPTPAVPSVPTVPPVAVVVEPEPVIDRTTEDSEFDTLRRDVRDLQDAVRELRAAVSESCTATPNSGVR